MSANRVKLRATSALLCQGQRVEPGSILTVAAAEAADMLDGGKVELLDPADRATIIAGRRADVARVLREAGRPLPPPADGPWFPIQ